MICCAARYIVDYVIGYLRTLVTSFIYISYLVPGFRLLHAAANVRQSLPERDRGGERKGERERSWERGDGHGDGKRGRGGGRKGWHKTRVIREQEQGKRQRDKSDRSDKRNRRNRRDRDIKLQILPQAWPLL